MNEADRLIYEKSNTYRLHADKMRWTLLGGYGAFLAAAAALLDANLLQPEGRDVIVFVFIFVFSMFYLMILAVQNWFYNLFAQFVKECEDRITRSIHLRPLENFAAAQGKHITPFHPSFFFAELVVGLASYFALAAALYGSLVFLFREQIVTLSQRDLQIFHFGLYMLLLLLMITFFGVVNQVFFRHWNRYIYQGIIQRFSNLFVTLPAEEGPLK